MAVDIRTTGNGKRIGGPADISGYSVSEEATPINFESLQGAVGSLSFEVNANAREQETLLLLNDTVELEDGSNGRVRGTVSNVSIRDGGASVDADSRTGLLVAFRDVAPYNGTLGGAFTYYFGLVGITSQFSIDPSITSRPVTYQGWSGDVWQAIKEICATEQVDVAQVSGNIVVRPLRVRELEVLKETNKSASVENRNLARNAEVEWFEGGYTATPIHVYPVYDEDRPTSFQVPANGTVVAEVPVYMSMMSVDVPEAVDDVSELYSGANSIYSVIDREAEPYSAAAWTALGGSVSVEILPDTKTMRITITGPNDPGRGPFRLAQRVNPGDEDNNEARPTLHIAAAGVVAIPRFLSQPTGAPDSKTARESSPTIKATFANTLSKAWSALTGLAGSYATSQQTVGATATVVNRRGEVGNANFATFADFDAEHAGMTFSQFDTAHSGWTFAQLDAEMEALVVDDFENQAFGNVAGARVRREDAYYRVQRATITPAGISYQAERDTTFADFDAAFAGMTFAQFDAAWAGMTFEDHDIAPLRKA